MSDLIDIPTFAEVMVLRKKLVTKTDGTVWDLASRYKKIPDQWLELLDTGGKQ
ncbi:MAG: hypothetical protein FWD88_07845 [Treponema sp.]|nr:hypothetical protein [Treponema sp.]